MNLSAGTSTYISFVHVINAHMYRLIYMVSIIKLKMDLFLVPRPNIHPSELYSV